MSPARPVAAAADDAAVAADPRPALIGMEEVARRLGVSVCTLSRRRAAWERDGMPTPLPWRAYPLVWRADAIDRWIAGVERRAGALGEPDGAGT